MYKYIGRTLTAQTTPYQTMEMTKKPPATTQQSAADIPPPSPFASASAEREDLERALLQSSTTSSQQQNYVVPTAVPITTNDVFDENNLSPPVVAAAATTLPPRTSSSINASSANNKTTCNNAYKSKSATNTHDKKTDSFIDCDNGEEDDNGIIVRPDTDTNYNNLPTASTIPTYTSNLPKTQQLTTSSQLRVANVLGNISSEDEVASVARAQRQTPLIQGTTNNAIQYANVKAATKKYKSDEGLTVDDRIHELTSSTKARANELKDNFDNDIRPYSNKPQQQEQKDGKKKEGGYEVKEYETSEYETSEYETSEYKSVYD